MSAVPVAGAHGHAPLPLVLVVSRVTRQCCVFTVCEWRRDERAEADRTRGTTRHSREPMYGIYGAWGALPIGMIARTALFREIND